MNHFYTAGQVAAATGINKETIRFYEKKELLPPPQQAENGYRQYGRETIQRIRFIKTAQNLGFSLQEIKGLLQLVIRAGESCGEIHQLAAKKLELIQTKITELRKMESALAEFSNRCSRQEEMADCDFVQTLWGNEGETDE